MSIGKKGHGRQKIEMKKMSSESNHSAIVREFNCKLSQINNLLDTEKKCGDELSHLLKAHEAQYWWACPIDKMNMTQLELFKKVLEEFKKLVGQHNDILVIPGAVTQTIPYFVENGLRSNISLHHQRNFHFFQNPMMQLDLFSFNNMVGSGAYESSEFF
ncbi:hypothetical protein RYX36_021109 [Vicia faba]